MPSSVSPHDRVSRTVGVSFARPDCSDLLKSLLQVVSRLQHIQRLVQFYTSHHDWSQRNTNRPSLSLISIPLLRVNNLNPALLPSASTTPAHSSSNASTSSKTKSRTAGAPSATKSSASSNVRVPFPHPHPSPRQLSKCDGETFGGR